MAPYDREDRQAKAKAEAAAAEKGRQEAKKKAEAQKKKKAVLRKGSRGPTPTPSTLQSKPTVTSTAPPTLGIGGKSNFATKPKPKPKPPAKTPKGGPIPLPSMSIGWETYLPVTRQGRIPDRPGEEPEPVATQYDFMDPESYLRYGLGVQSNKERADWRMRNQQKARADRERQRAEMRERREHLRSLPDSFKKSAGSRRISEFLRTGDYSILEGGSRGVVEGLVMATAKGAGSFLEKVGQSKIEGREGYALVEDTKQFDIFKEIALGHDLMNAAKGKSYNPYLLAADLLLLPIPIAKVPTAATAALRALIGVQRLRAAQREGLTVAEAVQTLTRPISEVKAARNAAIRSRVVAESLPEGVAGPATRPFGTGRLGERLAGDRNDWVSRILRNDPREGRKFRYGDAVVETPYALSRSGKLLQKAFDKARPVTSKVLPGVKSEDLKYAQIAARRADLRAQQLQLQLADIQRMMPSNRWGRTNWAEVYAARAVLKGVPIDQLIERAAADYAEAAAKGDTLGAIAQQHHLALYTEAARYVTTTTDETGRAVVVFSDEASEDVRALADEIDAQLTMREKILDKIGLLDEEYAKARVEAEKNYYVTGKLVSQNDDPGRAIRQNEHYRTIKSRLSGQHANVQDHVLTIVEAQARRYYDQLVGLIDDKIKFIEKSIREDHAMYADVPGQRTVRNAWKEQLEALKKQRDSIAGDVFFQRGFGETGAVIDEPSEDVVKWYTRKYGQPGRDWRYDIHELPHPYLFTPEQTAARLAQRERAGKLEWENERMFAKDDPMRDDIPLVGEITLEEMEKRLLKWSTPLQRAEDAAWYNNIQSRLGAILSDREIRAWLDTQKGQGPAGGFIEISKLLSYVDRGEDLPTEGISTTIDTLRRIMVEDDPRLTAGARQKISDFFDSAMGREFRTIMGGEEAGGAPMVIDRWSSRALGVPESKEAVNILRNRFGIEAKSAALGEPQYERLHKRYEEFVEYLNNKRFDGRDDWTASEVQAMDWYAVQRQWGNKPDTLDEALDAASYRADFELTRGANPSMQGADLDPQYIRDMADALEPELRALVGSVPGIRIRGFFVDTSGWAKGGNVSVHMTLFGEREAAQAAITEIARATDQGLVQASRWRTVSNSAYGLPSKAAIRYENPALAGNDALKREFFAKLVERHPDTFDGHSPLGPGQGGFGARTTRGNLTNDEKPGFAAKYLDDVREIERELNLPPGELSADNLQILIGSQHGAVTDITTGTADAGRVLMGDLSPDQRRIRRALVDYIAGTADPKARPNSFIRPSVDESLRGLDEDELLRRGWRPIENIDDLAEEVGVKGDELLLSKPGGAEAARMAEAGEYPAEFIAWVDENVGFIYDQYMIAKALDRAYRRGIPEEMHQAMDEAGDVFRIADKAPKGGAPHWLSSRIQVGGYYNPETQDIFVPQDGSWQAYYHEIMHMVEDQEMLPKDVREEIFKFLGYEKKFGEALPAEVAEDFVDVFEAMLLGFDEGLSKLSPKVKRAFKALRDDFKQTRNQAGRRRAEAMLERLPEELRLKVESVFEVEDILAAGGRYVPEVRGAPFSFAADLMAAARYPVLRGRLYRGQKVSTLTPSEVRLKKQFEGALIKSGHYDRDITKGTMEVVFKAIELDKMYALRGALLRGASDVPSNQNTIAIIVDPKTFYREHPEFAEKLKNVTRLFDLLDDGKSLAKQDLDDVSLQLLDDVKGRLFPGIHGDSDLVLQGIAAEIMHARTPIPGVKWVPENMLKEAGLMTTPVNPKNAYARAGLSFADTVNDIAKAATLAWNPAYYPMNMTGSGFMLGLQSGIWTPINLTRALVGMKGAEDILPLIDGFAGAGVTTILKPGARGVGVGKRALNATQHVGNVIIDKYPRRAAFIHEARRLGYRTPDELRDLTLNPARFNDLYQVAERTNRAMVDFRRMSKFEREFMTRVIFVYPWLKGSTKWTADAILDHPMAAAAFAGLIYYQQDRIKESFPEGYPGFMKWYLPLKQIGESSPYGFRMDQAFTPLQTLDLAAEIVYWIGDGAPGRQLPWGANEEAISSKLNPLLEEVMKTVTGWDPFTQHEVSQNLPDFFRRLIDPRERWASWSRLKKVLDGETHTGFYDTTQTQNWLRLFLGSLAPVNISQEKAAERAQRTQTVAVPDLSIDEKLANWKREAEELSGEEVPEEIVELRRTEYLYQEAESEYKKENDIDTGLSPQERLVVLLRTAAKLNPEKAAVYQRKESEATRLSDDAAQAAIDDGREALGLTRIGRIDARLAEARKEARIGG